MARLPGGSGFRSGPDRTVNQQEIEFLRRSANKAKELQHNQQHAITSVADHTSTATPGQILKADANGLPVDATNTDAAVVAAVAASHAAVTVAGAPLTLSGQQVTFNYDTNDFQLSGNNLQVKSSRFALVAQEAWNEIGAVEKPAFGAGWSNYDGTAWNTAAYYKDTIGVVHLKGLVKHATTGLGTVFTLPAGYRPALKAVFCVYVGNPGAGRIDIYGDGTVTVVYGNATYVSLEGITFRAV